MASDTQWVEDVRRWVASARPQEGGQGVAANAAAPDPSATPETTDADMDLGYEAANPALQAAHWPDTPSAAPDASP